MTQGPHARERQGNTDEDDHDGESKCHESFDEVEHIYRLPRVLARPRRPSRRHRNRPRDRLRRTESSNSGPEGGSRLSV